MRMKADLIRLGLHEWLVRPLTIAQVQAIEPILLASAEKHVTNIASALAILRVALSRDHADAADQLETIEAGAPDISSAMAQVLRLGGFLPASLEGAVTPGEAGAG